MWSCSELVIYMVMKGWPPWLYCEFKTNLHCKTSTSSENGPHVRSLASQTLPQLWSLPVTAHWNGKGLACETRNRSRAARRPDINLHSNLLRFTHFMLLTCHTASGWNRVHWCQPARQTNVTQVTDWLEHVMSRKLCGPGRGAYVPVPNSMWWHHNL